ncbi:hypothetical protein MWU54_12665 [Marivita sp. S6314]|uniref:hypothetical protein n=1 Tax=Marivita sp. S6314 TaxID=2926406 RepID=UPI001FF209D2|nr:hypothetical protein [Marivita sp. S6314]MCK0150884.1 hypothetical protein [Marivita sp. S6314]
MRPWTSQTGWRADPVAITWPDAGYIRYPWTPDTYRWSQTARAIGRDVARDPEMVKTWLQCEGTWFVGVDALPTDPEGTIGGVPLQGPFTDAIGPRDDLHPAQLSITFPGYPRPRAGETDAAFRYRQRRDAAHMDGVRAEGSPKRRFFQERHDWILGLPLTETSPGASPLVVWEGSHHILQAAMSQALSPHPKDTWHKIDVTEVYVAARKTVFETCARVPVFARPGEAILLHPYLLHGVAPWQAAASAPKDGRMIAYFRPESTESDAFITRQK